MLTHWISKLRKFKNKCRVVLLCIRISRCALIAQFFFQSYFMSSSIVCCVYSLLRSSFYKICNTDFLDECPDLFCMQATNHTPVIYIEKRLSICMHLTWNANEHSNRVFCKQCTWNINCLMQLLNLNKLSVFFYELVQLTNFKTYNISITSTTSTTTLT